MKKKQLATVQHDYIRYANVWEDAQILIEGLQAHAGGRHLSIASGGDNAFALLLTHPELVVAVDINPAQLAVCALKKAAIQHLNCIEFQQFIGFLPSNERWATYTALRERLSPEARNWWDAHPEIVEAGVVDAGKFERYFRLFAQRILPFIHSKKQVAALLAPKSAEEQARFYDKKWNTWRWRWLFNIFFSKKIMGWMGRDPAFLAQVEVAVGTFIFNKAEQHLQSPAAQDNFILRYNLTGNFGHLLPDYAQPQNYATIKAHIDRLVFYEGLADEAVAKFGQFHYFNLSDIFEYMDDATFRQVGQTFAAAALPGARFAYWNLMVPRNLAQVLPEKFSDEPALSAALSARDRGFFYNRFIVNASTNI